MGKPMKLTVSNDPAYLSNDTQLWVAVLDRAVRDLVALEHHRQDPETMKDHVFRYEYRTLIKWFHSTSMEPGSFKWICSLVNIDQEWALKRLKERVKNSLTSMFHRTREQEAAAATRAEFEFEAEVA